MTATVACRHILGMRVDASSYAHATECVITAARTSQPFWLCPASVPTVMEARRSSTFLRVMASADLVTPDGMPLVWTLRLTGVASSSRVYGPNLTIKVLEAAATSGLRVGFYGASQETIEKLVLTCKKRWPGLDVAYAHSPPFRQASLGEQAEAIQAIKASGVQILFVGLGCPKQEIWVHRHFQTLRMPVLAVGAAFDFIAGTKPQAPKWMQSSGLEWLFRLSTEPKRLWRRYLLGNPAFLLLLTAELLGLRKMKPPADPDHSTTLEN